MSPSSPTSPSQPQHKESSPKAEKKVEEAPETSQDSPTASSSAPAPAGEPEDDSDDLDLPEVGEVPKSPTGVIEMETFQQIREMDEDEDDDGDEDSDPREFSRSIVWGFFDQAEKTFGEMQQALRARDLDRLSSLGHFLKGSSAALGIINVQAICEKIQHYGHKHDEDQQPIEEEDALKRITSLLKDCKKDYVVAKAWLVNLYESGE